MGSWSMNWFGSEPSDFKPRELPLYLTPQQWNAAPKVEKDMLMARYKEQKEQAALPPEFVRNLKTLLDRYER